jgi:hypothetical protein
MTSAAAAKPLVFDVDFESEGDGTLTVQTAKVITSNDSDVTITAWDIDLDGSLTAGTMGLTIHGAQANQALGVGALTTDLVLEDAELGRIICPTGLTVGSVANGELQVKGVTDASSDSVGTVTLIATNDLKKVVFLEAASKFNKGIIIQAIGGVVLSDSLTTQLSETVIYSGTATLTVIDTTHY